MEPLIWITLPAAGATLAVALFQWTRSGHLARSLEDLNGFLSREALRVRLFQEGGALLLFLLAFILTFFLGRMGRLDPMTPWVLLSGGVCGALAAGNAGAITARNALRIAHRAGVEMKGTVQGIQSAGVSAGLGTQALALLYTAGWYCCLRFLLGYRDQRLTGVVMLLGLGAALYALITGLLGSLLTQGGALARSDLPVDGPENPTALIHWVGKGASYLHSLTADSFAVWVCIYASALALGSGAFSDMGMGTYARGLPTAVAAAGTLGSLLGTATLPGGELTGARSLSVLLRRGRWTALGITAALAAPLSFLFSGSWRCYGALLIGFAGGIFLRQMGRWFIASDSLPVWWMVRGNRGDGAGLLLDGLAWSFGAACVGLMILLLTALGGFFVLGGPARPEAGLYGVALVGVGLVSTLGMELTAGTCGAVASAAVGAARLGGLTEGLSTRLEGVEAVYRAAALDFRNWLTGGALFAGVVSCLAVGLRRAGRIEQLALARMMGGFLAGLLLVLLYTYATLFAVRRTGLGLAVTENRKFRENEIFFYRAYLSLGLSLVLREGLLPILSALILVVLTGLLLGREALLGLCLAVTGLGGVLGWFFTVAGLSWSSVLEALTVAKRVEKDSDRYQTAHWATVLGRPLEGVLGSALIDLVLLSAAAVLLFFSFA